MPPLTKRKNEKHSTSTDQIQIEKTKDTKSKLKTIFQKKYPNFQIVQMIKTNINP